MTKIVPAEEKVDHRRGIDHIGVSVVAVVHDGKGKILLQKRGPKARDERGNWDICGGAIEFGESIEEAIKRECSFLSEQIGAEKAYRSQDEKDYLDGACSFHCRLRAIQGLWLWNQAG